MIRQLPVIPTVLVLAAAATMVWLGFWQLGRAEEKAALIASYEQVPADAPPVAFPVTSAGEDVWFRRSSVDCANVIALEPVAGTAFNGAKGWVMRVRCAERESGSEVLVDLGFTQSVEFPDWQSGTVEGIIAPGPRLVADPVIDGLAGLAKPDPNDLPNNHLAYTGQWFLFALTALIIYWLAVRAKIAKRD